MLRTSLDFGNYDPRKNQPDVVGSLACLLTSVSLQIPFEYLADCSRNLRHNRLMLTSGSMQCRLVSDSSPFYPYLVIILGFAAKKIIFIVKKPYTAYQVSPVGDV